MWKLKGKIDFGIIALSSFIFSWSVELWFPFDETNVKTMIANETNIKTMIANIFLSFNTDRWTKRKIFNSFNIDSFDSRDIHPSGHTDVLKTSKGRPFWTLGRPLWTSKDVPFEITLVRPLWTSADVYFGLETDLYIGRGVLIKRMSRGRPLDLLRTKFGRPKWTRTSIDYFCVAF